MTTETNNQETKPWITVLVTALFSVLLTLIVLAPFVYKFWKMMPPPVASVDLQKIIEDDQQKYIDQFSKGEITDSMRDTAQKDTVMFAKKLSGAVDQLGKECHCVLVNKAALLSGAYVDFTDEIRSRMK